MATASAAAGCDVCVVCWWLAVLGVVSMRSASQSDPLFLSYSTLWLLVRCSYITQHFTASQALRCGTALIGSDRAAMSRLG